MGNKNNTPEKEETLDKLLKKMRQQFYVFNCIQEEIIKCIFYNELQNVEECNKSIFVLDMSNNEKSAKMTIDDYNNKHHANANTNIINLAKLRYKLENGSLNSEKINIDEELHNKIEFLKNFLSFSENETLSNIVNEEELPTDDTIHYFWIEYTTTENGKEVTRKISLFAKIYDKGSTNMHVLPGVREDWLLKKPSEKIKSKCYIANTNSISFTEGFNITGCNKINKKGETIETKNGWLSGSQHLVIEKINENNFWVPVSTGSSFLDSEKKGPNYYMINEMKVLQETFISVLTKIQKIPHNKELIFSLENGKDDKFSILYREYGFCWINYSLIYPDTSKQFFEIKGKIFPYNIFNISGLGCFYKYGSFMFKFNANDEVMKDYYSAPNVNRKDFTISFLDNNDNTPKTQPFEMQLLYNSKKNSKKPYWFNYSALGDYLESLFQNNQE